MRYMETKLTDDEQATITGAIDRFLAELTTRFDVSTQRLREVRDMIGPETKIPTSHAMALAIATLDSRSIGVEPDRKIIGAMNPERWNMTGDDEPTADDGEKA